jgi:hypothetical protein
MEKSWDGYLNALGTQKRPRTMIDTQPFSNTEGGPPTGFVQWATPNPKQQAKYDAMAGSWQGVKASESAAATSIYKADHMPVTN